MEMENPDTSHLKGPCSLEAQNPTPASPDWCLQSYFFSLLPNPNKTHQLLQRISGLVCCFFCFPWIFLFVFYFKYWKSPLGSAVLPTLIPFLPHSLPFFPQQIYFKDSTFLPTQTINIQFLAFSAEPEESSASFIFRQFLLSDIRSPVISKLARHSSTQLN